MMPYSAIVARTEAVSRPVEPLAYDCVKVIVVRSGSAVLFSEFGQQRINVGDVVFLGEHVLCGSKPDGNITITAIYLDTDYVLDQLFWQYVGIIPNRIEIEEFADTLYSEPAQVLRLGQTRTHQLIPWLDEMVALSVDAHLQTRFHRIQALWFLILDVIAPFVQTSTARLSCTQRARSRPTFPRHRQFNPLRDEAIQARNAMAQDVPSRWTLERLACTVHLSSKQLARVFTDTYGKTPMAYLTMLRVNEMAHLLRATNMTIAEAARRVGWQSRSRAAEAFRELAGVTPGRYRAMHPRANQPDSRH